jgi:hypothetical protein
MSGFFVSEIERFATALALVRLQVSSFDHLF